MGAQDAILGAQICDGLALSLTEPVRHEEDQELERSLEHLGEANRSGFQHAFKRYSFRHFRPGFSRGTLDGAPPDAPPQSETALGPFLTAMTREDLSPKTRPARPSRSPK